MSVAFVQRGTGWVIAQSVLMVAVVLLPYHFRESELSAWSVWVGGFLMVIGGAVGIAGVWVLGSKRTPFPRPRENSEFIQHGIYAHVRHPLYLSAILASLGWALIWQSWPSLVIALTLIPFFQAKATLEERWLRETFPDYADYEHRVPRFIPSFRRCTPVR